MSSLAPPIAAPLGDVTTERLELRRFRPDDVDELAPVFAQEAVWRYPYGRGMSRDETETFVMSQVAHWDEHRFGLWVAGERATGRRVGYVGLAVPTFLPEILPAVEVGWRFEPAVWGRGYATEAATAALDEAFTTLGLDEVCSLPQVDNPASCRVADRLGLRPSREMPLPANARRNEVIAVLYEIDRDSWLRSRGALGPDSPVPPPPE
jgi:RimJ/RimL family protein N-acetyltransferase